jgi:hypothetical protein
MEEITSRVVSKSKTVANSDIRHDDLFTGLGTVIVSGNVCALPFVCHAAVWRFPKPKCCTLLPAIMLHSLHAGHSRMVLDVDSVSFRPRKNGRIEELCKHTIYLDGWPIPVRVVPRLHPTRSEYCTTAPLAFQPCEIATRLQLSQVADHNTERVNLDFMQTKSLRSRLRSSDNHGGSQRA